jgi:type IV secretion/conjugal transfer VirB4 family ATPase
VTRFSRIWKDYQDAGALHALVGIEAAVDDQTFATKGGALVTVLAVQGSDYECLDPGQLDQLARRFESAIRTLDESFRLYQYLIKRDHAPLPRGRYDNPVVEEAIVNRVAYLEEKAGRLYTLETYFVVVYEGWRPQSGRPDISALLTAPRLTIPQILSTERTVTGLETGLTRACQTLRDKVAGLTIQLQDWVPVEILDKQRAFRFFRQLLNYTPYKANAVGLAYDQFVDFQACDSALECHRDHLRLDDHYVEVLTLKTPPGRTFAHMFKAAQEIPANLIIASEWKRENPLAMRRLIQAKRRHFHNAKSSLMNYVSSSSQASPKDMLVDDGAVALVGDLGACLEEIEVNGRYFGQFSLTVVLLDRDRDALKRSIAECVKAFGAQDATLVQERYNLLNAWLAVLPGNHANNLRRFWLLDNNYADLAFLFTQRRGELQNAHLGAEYLAVFESEIGTPYFFNLHYGDNAHTLVLGATGSGKSFLLNFLLTLLQKYLPFTYIFDLGGSYRSLTRLFQGSYLPIGGEDHAFTINPFSLPARPENIQFLYSFCKVLIESGGYRMTALDDRDLAAQIENVYAVEPDQRRLYTLANIVNRTLRAQLQKWVQGGQYAAWFDNVVDTLTLSRFQTFDFEGMDKRPEVLEPLLFYVLHRTNAAINAPEFMTTFKAFVMDEAWRFFRHPTIRNYIVEALKTWRKKQAAMLLATQSVDDLIHSEMLSVVAESCATKIFLANPGMDRQSYRDTFHLNETEAARISALIPKQQLLVKRPDLAKVLNLHVDRKGYWLYTNNPADNQARHDAFERHGFKPGLELLARRNS